MKEKCPIHAHPPLNILGGTLRHSVPPVGGAYAHEVSIEPPAGISRGVDGAVNVSHGGQQLAMSHEVSMAEADPVNMPLQPSAVCPELNGIYVEYCPELNGPRSLLDADGDIGDMGHCRNNGTQTTE